MYGPNAVEMTPAQRIRELIQTPLAKCYLAEMPKKSFYTPQRIARMVSVNRQKMRRYLSELRA